ncbi:RHS repeat-associated core domain-containing protein [Streptococcus suis]|uniref:RHS repeat-associated core domain-containing protein n=2 Tax=Streptococcus suis TaxID=1307 RepID=UPI0004115EA5|nr:RHS repeat-associated core domain-containing protein [Streptococcus suis]
MVNPPSEDNLPGEDEVLYRSQVQDVLIPYTTKEDTYNYYETRNYVNDVNQQHTQVLQTYDDQLQKRETYVYGNGRATYTNESTGDSYHYLTSQSGSVTVLTQNGQAVASSSYALYGATKQTTDTTGNLFAYNGEARDVTGLDYLRARYYDSQAGTFLTADSYSGSQTDPLSQNLYAYVQNNPANYTDPSGHIRSPHVMLDDRFGGKVYKNPRPLINTDDGTLYAPSTPEHKAHQIRQQQTGNYSYVYTPKVYSNTPIIKPTSYAQAQAQRDRAREQALAEQRRQQNIRNEYSRATGSKGKAKTREAQNLFKNWGAALSSMYTHVCKTAKRWVDSGVKFLKNVDWKKVGVTVGAIGVGIALTVATGGLGAPAAMALGGAATGAIISGYDGYTSGKRGWELVGAIGQGAGVGALTGFVGGHLMGAGAGIATSATQNIRNQAVRHVVKAGIEAGVETAVDTGLDLATGNAVTGQTVAMNFGYNLISNGGGSVSAKKGANSDVDTNKSSSNTDRYSIPDKVVRSDNDFYSQLNSKGRAKSHIDQSGALVPANQNGIGSIVSHIRGGNSKNSPYISTSDVRLMDNAKNYGSNTIEINTKKLSQDISSGKISGVELISNGELIDNLTEYQGKKIQNYHNNRNLDNYNKVLRAAQDISNVKRDGEFLIKGVVPSDYISYIGGK